MAKPKGDAQVPVAAAVASEGTKAGGGKVPAQAGGSGDQGYNSC